MDATLTVNFSDATCFASSRMEPSCDECQGTFGDIGAVWDHVIRGQEMTSVPTRTQSRLLLGHQQPNFVRREICAFSLSALTPVPQGQVGRKQLISRTVRAVCAHSNALKSAVGPGRIGTYKLVTIGRAGVLGHEQNNPIQRWNAKDMR